MPDEVIEAVAQVYRDGISNRGDRFAASRRAGEVVGAARAAVADLINAGPHEIAFGQNMTSITFAASRAISRDWSEGDRILVTSLDHDANVTPWREAAADKGAVVDMVTFDTE